MQIKLCEINDLESLTPLFDDYRQHFKQSSDPAAVKAYLQQRIEANEAIIYLAHSGDEIHGFVMLYPSFSSIGLAPIWILNDMYLKSGSNKRLMALQLLDQIVEDCKAAGAIRIEVTTRKENHKLHKLYKDYGFEKDYKYDYYFLQVTQAAAADMLK
ncbi:GNAT family N-acetyltransferase [Kangiella sp. TOML190]|uniref:GNAT family N-acetyltransferase n=1 Tax=Kangiella sp. TOML190 TaxID=2931351 RepID=UPI00203C9941|nr:GNAT family N-acetyltransferase [Kangiella sp. TOML190]